MKSSWTQKLIMLQVPDIMLKYVAVFNFKQDDGVVVDFFGEIGVFSFLAHESSFF